MEFQRRKLEEIRLSFELRGETISDWADRNGFSRDAVYAGVCMASTGSRMPLLWRLA